MKTFKIDDFGEIRVGKGKFFCGKDMKITYKLTNGRCGFLHRHHKTANECDSVLKNMTEDKAEKIVTDYLHAIKKL